MSSKSVSPIRQAWYKWKSLRLPWRRRVLIGFDLKGYTFWEFRIAGSDPNSRWRRIVHYPRSTHYSEVKVSPEWHQWLRYMRPNPPTLDEQHMEIARQGRVKMLAAQADARWEAKPKVMQDMTPREETLTVEPAVPSVEGDKAGEADPVAAERGQKIPLEEKEPQQQKQRPTEEPAINTADPWAGARARGPSENWQPQAWTPSKAKR